MPRLDFDADEKISRKEYLKRKKKQKKMLKGKNRVSYILIGIIVILSIYVFTQFYVYSKASSYKYIEDDLAKRQKVYNIYYITEGYTYNPKYTLNSIHSDGFNDKVLDDNLGFRCIVTNQNYVYGLKETGLYRLDKNTNNQEMLIQNGVNKYTIYDNDIYVITGDNDELGLISQDTKEYKDMGISGVQEVLIDKDYIYVAIKSGINKDVYKYDKSGVKQIQLTKDVNASYMIQDDGNIYFVNKSDSSKIYKISKNENTQEKLADVTCMADDGELKDIDGSKYMFINSNMLYYVNTSDNNNLWAINLSDKTNQVVIQMSLQILQNVDNTVFFKVKGEMGVYLYNYNTKFMSQVTKNNASEFYVDSNDKVDIQIPKTSDIKN